MDAYRVIFAVIAGVAGAVLLLLAAKISSGRNTPLRKRRVLTSILYGTLFLAAGALLWVRKDADLVTDIKYETRVEAPIADLEPPPAQAVIEETQPQPPEPRIQKPIGHRSPFVDVSPQPHLPPMEPEERVEQAIGRVFTAVEAFFYRYGHSAEVSPQ